MQGPGKARVDCMFFFSDYPARLPEALLSDDGQRREGEGEGRLIARGGIEHSQSRQPRRCTPPPPCHADVAGDLARRVAAPATKAAFYWVYFP